MLTAMFVSSDSMSLMVWVLVICLTTMFLWPGVRRELQLWKYFNKIQGPSYIEQIKTLCHFINESERARAFYHASIVPYFKKYPVIAVGAGPMRTVCLCKAEAAKVLLSSKTQVEKSNMYKHIRVLVGDGVATSKRAKWHQRRRLLNPSFNMVMMENYVVVMNEQTDILVHLLEEKAKQTNGSAFDVCPYLSRYTLDIICETAMSQKMNSQTKTDSAYCGAVQRLMHSLPRRSLNLWLWFDIIYRLMPIHKQDNSAKEIIDGFTDEIVKNKLRQCAESNMANGPKSQSFVDDIAKKRRLAMLDILVEMSVEDSGNGTQTLTAEDMRDEVKTFVLGGFETSLLNISWALYRIGRNPVVQQKIVDELNLVYGDDDRHSSCDDLNNLKYLGSVIKETLRLHPPGSAIGRHLTEEMSICGTTIPADTEVVISIYWVHRDPAHYPDPDLFDPDRFLPENSQGRHPFAFIPFSAGPRNCIGQRYAMMQAKVILAAILRRFKVTSLEQDLVATLTDNFISNPCHGVWVQLDTRKTSNNKK